MATLKAKLNIHTTPTLRFPEFSGEWSHVQLSHLLTESKTRNSQLIFGKDKVLSVSGEFGIVNQVEHMGRSYAGESVHNYHVVESGDIVYTKSPLKANPYGIIKINKGKPGIVSTLYAVYKVNEANAVGTFLDHYFSLDANTNRYLRPLVKKGAKNDMKINNAYVLNDKIFVPTLNEQKRIVELLDAADAWIKNIKAQHRSLELFKKGLIQKIFSQEIRFKDKNGNEFPEWEKQKLGQLLEYRQPTNYIVKSTEYSDSYKIPVLTAGKTFILGYTNETSGVFESDNLPVIIFDDFTTASKFVDFPFKVKSSAMKILLAKGDDRIKFIYEAMKLIRFEVGGHGRHWISHYSKIEIPVPSIQEQIKIEECLTSIDDILKSAKEQITQAEQWKKGLLQQLFI